MKIYLPVENPRVFDPPGPIMFDNLSDKLRRVFKTLVREGKLSAENMEVARGAVRSGLPSRV